MTILGPKKGIPSLAAARLKRWVIQLPEYRYEIEFRLPLDVKDSNNGSEAILFNIYKIQAPEIQRANLHDPVHSQVLHSHEIVVQIMCLDS